MNQDVRLFLCGMEADLNGDPKIYYNYTVTDTTKPSVVKNSFSKNITLPGSQQNNAIFGQIWDLSRFQTYGSGSYIGSTFNPLKKAEFELFVDNNLYESGYFKLTEIIKNLNTVEYNITLYGGLGEFLYNLTYTEGGNKMEFKDLSFVKYSDGESTEFDLSFDISKETVKDAWDYVSSYSSKYSILNFAPQYGGLPKDFDSNKFVMNYHGLTGSPFEPSYNDWALGTASRQLQMWETRDLRSYLFRPVLRARTLIETCCYPENNGGYDVDLDSHFFTPDNPYYENTWITLPMLSDIMGQDDQTEAVQMSPGLTEGERKDNARYYEIESIQSFSGYTNVSFDLTVNVNTATTTTASTLYLCNQQKYDTNFTLSDRYVKNYDYFSAILLQLIAYDGAGNIIATSDAYQLTGRIRENGEHYSFADLSGEMESKKVSIPSWHTLYGSFKKIDNKYTWVDEFGYEQKIHFEFNSNTKFRTLKLRVQQPYMEAYRRTGFHINGTSITQPIGGTRLYTTNRYTASGNTPLDTARYTNAVETTLRLKLSNFYALLTKYGGFLSGTHVDHDKLLTLGITPAEFLLSYIKLFGLHIWKEPDNNIIHIADRNTYYDTESLVDLEELIDRGKPMKITPQVASAKWYDFNTEQNESEANTEYISYYGVDYGLQRVNTGYDFDSGNTKVYEGAFKGAVQVLENSPYYFNDFNHLPAYVYNGFTYNTFSISESGLTGSDDITFGARTGANSFPLNADYAGFDLFDKPQFHKEDNEPTEGKFSLLFYVGNVPTSSATAGDIDYYLTDDIDTMVDLNSKKPCWIMTRSTTDTSGNTIAIKVTSIPKFSRFITYTANGYVTHTLDFGKTQETYVPGSFLTSGCSIYEKCWKNYIADMYDVNSRVLNCYCNIRTSINSDWLRRFYWFDNSIWRLNKVKEWNPGTMETTNVEFIKVMNKANYQLKQLSMSPIIDFYLPDYTPVSVESTSDVVEIKNYTIDGTVTAVTASIEVQDGGPWAYGDGPGANYSLYYNGLPYDSVYAPYTDITASHEDHGSGNTMDTFILGINPSGISRTFNFNIIVYASREYRRVIHLTQNPVYTTGSFHINGYDMRNFVGSSEARTKYINKVVINVPNPYSDPEDYLFLSMNSQYFLVDMNVTNSAITVSSNGTTIGYEEAQMRVSNTVNGLSEVIWDSYETGEQFASARTSQSTATTATTFVDNPYFTHVDIRIPNMQGNETIDLYLGFEIPGIERPKVTIAFENNLAYLTNNMNSDTLIYSMQPDS